MASTPKRPTAASAGRITAVAFDFDQTITRVNMTNARDQESGQKLFGTAAKAGAYFHHPPAEWRTQFLSGAFAGGERTRELLVALKRQGVKLYVASFGYRHLIDEVVWALFGDEELFSAIYTPADFGAKENSDDLKSKLAMMKAVVGASAHNSALLVDDSASNIRSATGVQVPVAGTVTEPRTSLLYRGFYVLSDEGLTMDALERIVAYVTHVNSINP